MTKAEQKEAQRRILQELGARVVSYGFRSKPIGQSFDKDISGGRWVFHIGFIRHEADIDVTADVAVRIDVIEQVVNQFETGLTDAEKSRSMTIGSELGNLSRGQPLRWTVSDVGEVAAVADEIVRAFEKVGLPYLRCQFRSWGRSAGADKYCAAGSNSFTDFRPAVHARSCGSLRSGME